MRLLMYQEGNGAHLGALTGDGVVDLAALAAQAGGPMLPNDMLGLIDMGEAGLRRAHELLDQTDRLSSTARALDQVTLLPPLDPPRGNVLAIGRNYRAHAAEMARARGEEMARPTVFTKAQTAINSPYGDIVVDDRVSTQLDWEAELGVVIGQRVKNVAAEDALQAVFGYTVVNDVSARDIQYGWGGQFFKGKSLDGSCPIGPCIVTADELPDPQSLRIRLKVNGEIKQAATTADMIFPVSEIIAYLALGMTLEPGNVIATGTPEGVGHARTPPEFLKPGDVMETEIEGIGVLRNRVVAGA